MIAIEAKTLCVKMSTSDIFQVATVSLGDICRGKGLITKKIKAAKGHDKFFE